MQKPFSLRVQMFQFDSWFSFLYHVFKQAFSILLSIFHFHQSSRPMLHSFIALNIQLHKNKIYVALPSIELNVHPWIKLKYKNAHAFAFAIALAYAVWMHKCICAKCINVERQCISQIHIHFQCCHVWNLHVRFHKTFDITLQIKMTWIKWHKWQNYHW